VRLGVDGVPGACALAAAAVGALVAATVAAAGATPVAPAAGAVVSSQPTLAWTLPDNEVTDAVFVATSPALTASGDFGNDVIVDAGVFENDVRRWTPTDPLYAGRYWWLVVSHDVESLTYFRTAPRPFVVRAEVALRRVSARTYPRTGITQVVATWRSNARDVTVRARIVRGVRTLAARRFVEDGVVGSDGLSSFTWKRPRSIRPGTPLRLLVTVSGGGASRTRTVSFRAPR
jgi:hypothetical protein